jgi:hypothetical protein
VHWPYTLDFNESYLVAQWGAAMLLTAALFFWRLSNATRAVLLLGIWTAAVAIIVPQSLAQLSFKPGPHAYREVLMITSALGVLAALVSGRVGVAIVAALGVYPLWWLTGKLLGSESELASLHLAWLGLITGLLGKGARPRHQEPPRVEAETSYVVHDTLAFTGATVLAAVMCVYVHHKGDGGADEWGYTFQAAVFAKGHAYALSPRCDTYLENFYVYDWLGRRFSQYTPGWPMFMVPFVWIRQVWLSGPFSLGVLAWGMARLGRTAMRAFGWRDAPPSAREIRAAGTWAALMAALGTTLVVNAASRYPHVYTLALYAWTLEALMQVGQAGTPGQPRKRQILWGIVLGTASVHMVAVRPAEGAFMGIGVALVFLWFLARRQVGWRAFVAGTAAFAFWSAVMLGILRLQLGTWFTTGYKLNEVFHTWNVVKFSRPQLSEWKYGLPLATGSYAWWPASVPLGLAGMAQARGKARALIFAMAVSCIPYIVFDEYLDLGQRGIDWGYGPRYLKILMVPMMVGSALVLAPLTRAALSRADSERSPLARGGPLALALLAVATVWFRVVPLEWATTAEHIYRHSAVNRAIDEAHLKSAIVLVIYPTTEFDNHDLTTNYPTDLYPDQDVIIAIDNNQPREAAECLRSAFPGRRLYRAQGRDEVRITPF